MRNQYNGDKQDSTNYTTLEYLHINSCGIQSTQGMEYQVIREPVIIFYMWAWPPLNFASPVRQDKNNDI